MSKPAVVQSASELVPFAVNLPKGAEPLGPALLGVINAVILFLVGGVGLKLLDEWLEQLLQTPAANWRTLSADDRSRARTAKLLSHKGFKITLQIGGSKKGGGEKCAVEKGAYARSVLTAQGIPALTGPKSCTMLGTKSCTYSTSLSAKEEAFWPAALHC